MIITELETHYKSIRDNFNENFRLRIHRSISWLKRAKIEENEDMKFVSLWIAFNAAYAKELAENFGEKVNLNEFLLKLCSLDKENKIYNLIWKTFPHAIRMLLDNKFVFQPFWDFHNGKISEAEYIKAEMIDRERFYSALEKQKTAQILSVLFNRLYTMRNQIIHGGSTYGGSKNRDQVRDSCRILTALLPEMLQIMMNNHDEVDWGKPFYPVVKE
ncbi:MULTISPECIES: hypothetical protein [unclassified Lonepinella]|uniref:hypothetical protein n=1 Tax=unclassified Lonepinella TaxID=2642006 RepID=UPI0036DF2AED